MVDGYISFTLAYGGIIRQYGNYTNSSQLLTHLEFLALSIVAILQIRL